MATTKLTLFHKEKGRKCSLGRSSAHLPFALTILFGVVLMSQPQSAVSDGTACTQVYEFNAVYNFQSMRKTTDYSYTMGDNSKVIFQFCSTASRECLTGPAYAVWVSADNQACYRLTGSQVLQAMNSTLINSDSPELGIILTIPSGDYYPPQSSSNNQSAYTGERYETRFVIRCDTNTSATDEFQIENVERTVNVFTITGRSKGGCPQLQLSQIWEDLAKNKILFTIILIVIGIAECFFGLKLLPLTLFIIGYFTGFGLLVAILGQFVVPPGANVLVVWVLLIIAVVLGLLLGYLTTTARRMGFFFLGFWMGTVLAFLINNVLLHKLSNSTVPLYIAIGTMGSFFGILSCFFYKHIVIISTSLVGAYALIRPFGWIASGFPNEFTIAQQIQYHMLKGVPNEFYLYFTLIFVVAGIGMRWQYYYYFRDEELAKRNKEEEFEGDNPLEKLLKRGKSKQGEGNETLLGDQDGGDGSGNEDNSKHGDDDDDNDDEEGATSRKGSGGSKKKGDTGKGAGIGGFVKGLFNDTVDRMNMGKDKDKQQKKRGNQEEYEMQDTGATAKKGSTKDTLKGNSKNAAKSKKQQGSDDENQDEGSEYNSNSSSRGVNARKKKGRDEDDDDSATQKQKGVNSKQGQVKGKSGADNQQSKSRKAKPADDDSD